MKNRNSFQTKAPIFPERDLVVPISTWRVFVDCTLEGLVTEQLLLDCGATSTSINQSIVSKIEALKGQKLPRLDKSLSVHVFGQKRAISQMECVVINISINSQIHCNTI